MASVPTGGGSFPGWQLPDSDGEIKGMRFNPGWGYHKTVYGLDFGLIGNTTSKEFAGIALAGLFITNLGKTIVTGMQFSGLYNSNRGKSYIVGMQFTAGINSTGKGESHISGIQFAGLGNLGNNNIYGLQIGIYNEAKSVYGFQIGVLNKTSSLHGIQIGLVNIAKNGLLPFFPVINIGF